MSDGGDGTDGQRDGTHSTREARRDGTNDAADTTEERMSDTERDDGPSTGTEPTASEQEPRPGSGDDGGRGLRRKLDYVLLAGLALFALVAALQLYINASAAIDQWVADEYRSLFQAAFNLTVLLLVGAGLARQARRLAGDEQD